MLLLGAPGTGKTLLLRSLAAALRAEGRSAGLYDPTAPMQATGAILLVDEADTLAAAALAGLLASSRPVLLAALPGAARRLQALAPGVVPVSLAPLGVEEVARFVAARLPPGRITPAAVLALARRSGGAMRLVTGLAHAALFLADARPVDAWHVEEAARLRGLVAEPPAKPQAASPLASGSAPPAPPRVGPWVGPAAALVAGAVAGVLVTSLLTRRPAEEATATGAPAALVAAEASPAPPIPPAPLPAPAPPDIDAAMAPEPALPLPPPPTQAPTQAAPDPPPVSAAATFRGPVLNETLQRGGQLAITILRRDGAGPVTLRFHASAGLIGTGELTGSVSASGDIRATGRLMMGRNPHDCLLVARLSGDRLTGSASFRRADRDSGETRSSFVLERT